MTGGNVTESEMNDELMQEQSDSVKERSDSVKEEIAACREGYEKWAEVASKVIADNLVYNVGELLDGEIRRYIITDHKGKVRRRIVIDF
jgi:hypothetical protein